MPRLGPTVNLVLLCAAGVVAAQDGESPRVDPLGRALYLKHCASCHGEEGRGDGPQKVFPPARDFRQGGFSFGNTPEALFKTVSSGIPGTAMVSFKDQMSQEQRRLVAEFVLTLVPESARPPPMESRVFVTDRAAIVRGYLPGPNPGGPSVARGLAVGIAGGWTFVYRLDDVRLLEVRRGPFVDRTDWRGRGGTALALLGNEFRRFDTDGPPAFWLVSGAEPAPLSASFRASFVRGARGGLECGLAERGGAPVATIDDVPEVDTLRAGMGWTREIVFRDGREGATVAVLLPSVPDGAAPVSGYPAESAAPASIALEADAGRWLVCALKDGGFEAVRLVGPPGAALVRVPAGWALAAPVGREARTIKISVVRLPQWSEELLDDLARDLL